MIRWIAAAGFVVAVATSAQAITPAPIPQSDGMITQVRFGCGPGRTLVAGPLRGQNHHPSYPPSHPQELLRAHPPAAANCAIKQSLVSSRSRAGAGPATQVIRLRARLRRGAPASASV